MYAATHPYTVDENGNRKYVYCHWGVVDKNKKCRDTACRPQTRQIPECGAPHGHDCNADLGIVWTARRTGEVLPADEESTDLHKQFPSTLEVLDEMHCDGIKINDTYVMALYIFPKPRQVPEAAFGAVLINSSEEDEEKSLSQRQKFIKLFSIL